MNGNFDVKRANGQYYTQGNPFKFKPFEIYSEQCNLSGNTVLEPFAGNGDIPRLIDCLMHINDVEWYLYDINPTNIGIIERDTLSDFPKGFDICITNPPWLARNSATRRGLPFPELCVYDDLYKYAIEQCLINCKWVAAIIPESFIRSGLFVDRLLHFVSIVPNNNSEKFSMFSDTEHPVGLALFGPDITYDVSVWRNDFYLGSINQLRKYLPTKSSNKDIVFNDSKGNLGLISIDNTISPSIRFCDTEELMHYQVSHKCRSITKISVPEYIHKDIQTLNNILNDIRNNTYDIFLTAFKGLRKDGYYRRRLHFSLARSIIDYDDMQMKLI